VSPLLITVLAMAGLVVGWGQRVVIFRYAVPAGDPVRRCCPACRHQMLPSAQRSWLLSPSGRCPACRERTGPPPLTVEATSAILLGALAARIHPGLVLAAACWLAVCAIPLAFVDAAVRRLPDALTASAYAGTAVFLLLAATISGHWQDLVRAALGGIALAAFYLALALISPAGMGLGDVKAAASLGTLLAWPGWRILVAGGLTGLLLAAVYGVALLVTGRATRKQHIPFGPFMIAGTFLIILAWTGAGP
jgi:leader peptidase (prepilin peptidase) / N-methyltransferase